MSRIQDELHDAIQENIHLLNYEEQLDQIIVLLKDILIELRKEDLELVESSEDITVKKFKEELKDKIKNYKMKKIRIELEEFKKEILELLK